MRTANAKKAPGGAKLAVLPGGRAHQDSKYEALFEQASDAIIAVRADGTIDAANFAAEDMSGFT
ncbi:MAG: PAS domain S-box protein, partial [Bdellovibrionota bacterium]